MRRRAILIIASLFAVAACGSFLGLNDEDDDPPNPPTNEAGGGAGPDGGLDGQQPGTESDSADESSLPNGDGGKCADLGDPCSVGGRDCCTKTSTGASLACTSSICRECVASAQPCLTASQCCGALGCQIPNGGTGQRQCCIPQGSSSPCKESGECCSGQCDLSGGGAGKCMAQ
jgi:hypothetical protein